MRQIFEYHPTIGYRFVPGVRTRLERPDGGGYLIRANEQGFRSDHEFVNSKPSGERRVLLFGDSFTAGDGVSNGKRFGDILERGVSGGQVYNFGLPGTGTDQHYLVYREFAQGIDHDLVVIAVLAENIRRVAARYRFFTDDKGERVCFAKPYFALEEDRPELHGVPVPKKPLSEEEIPQEERAYVDRGVGGSYGWLKRLAIRLGLKETVQRLLGFDPVPEYRDRDGAVWRLMAAILSEWIVNHPKPVLLVPIPLYQHVEEISSADHYRARFAELADRLGCGYYDLLPDLLSIPRGERQLLRFKTDNHLTERGHAVVAELMAPHVRRHLE